MDKAIKKSLYFMPFISVDNTIKYEKIKLVKNECQYDDLLPDLFHKKDSGIFVEIDGVFNNKDEYNVLVQNKIYDSIEILKFAYFSTNLPMNTYPGFLSDSTFEVFAIIESNEDKSKEHKIEITNGINTFLMKLDDYYKYKSILGHIASINLTENSLPNLKCIYNGCINDNTKLSIIKLYNKCLRLTNINDCFDKIIFARTSIETLILSRKKELSKKTYVKKFLEKTYSFILKHKNINLELCDFYDDCITNKNDIDKSIKKLNNYLKENLANARNDLLHENKTTINIFEIMGAYMVWFPLFCLIEYFENELTEKNVVSFILFIKLLQLDYEQWNKKNDKNLSKKTCLEAYFQCVRSINLSLNENDKENIKNHIEGFKKYFNNI